MQVDRGERKICLWDIAVLELLLTCSSH